jgi:D-alanine-D-alanine ligase
VGLKVVLIYNQPDSDRYTAMGESKAELGVLDEVHAVQDALNELNYPSLLLPLSPPLKSVKQKLAGLNVDVAFNLFEGFEGSPETEAKVAEMLADLKIPFTGCPSQALALALDKTKTKDLLKKNGIPTPEFQLLNADNISKFKLKYPCIVKPVAEDASHGLSEESVVHDFAALKKQVAKISSLFGGQALVEEFIDGREFNTTVLGNNRLSIPAISEIVYSLPPDKPRVLTFDAKWEEESLYFKSTKAVCPARITLEEEKKIGLIAKAAFRLLGCRGYGRVDFRQDCAGNFVVLEVNPNPDITPGSGAALQTQTAGMSYTKFVEKIIRLALR